MAPNEHHAINDKNTKHKSKAKQNKAKGCKSLRKNRNKATPQEQYQRYSTAAAAMCCPIPTCVCYFLDEPNENDARKELRRELDALSEVPFAAAAAAGGMEGSPCAC